jgi:TPR repeat protein
LPRIIVKSGHIKNGTHRSTYLKYIATRDGVEIHTSSNGHLKATKKQQTLIEQLLEDYPDSKAMFEYQDYLDEPTRLRASSYITAVMDFNLESVMQKENYVGYIAHRPRVEKLGEHGLFSNTDEVIHLPQVAKEIKEHKGNVWTQIISLKREDATRLGYDNAEHWKHVCRSKTYALAKAMKIEPVNLKWYAAFHNEGHHPHIHMVIYSKNPKEGYLNVNGIKSIRGIFAKEIFQNDILHIYKTQTNTRDTLKNYSKTLVTNLLKQIGTYELVDNENIFSKIKDLQKALKKYHGRCMYAYIPKSAKQIVNDIMRGLEKDEKVQQLYEQWLLYKQEVHETYHSTSLDRLPLLEQKEFKSIKNMILTEVMQSKDIIDAKDTITNIQDEDETTDIDTTSMYENFYEENISHVDSTYKMEWNATYKKAIALFYGSVDQKQDREEAKVLLEEEAKNNNILALEALGKYYHIQSNEKQAEMYYQKVFVGAEQLLNKNANTFVQGYVGYKVGKLYYYGLGVTQNYEKAYYHFLKSENPYAKYTLGVMYEQGLGVDISEEQALYYFRASAKAGNAFAKYKVGQYLEKGIVDEQNIEQAKEYYQNAYAGLEKILENGEDDTVLYRLAFMNYYGKGVEKDATKAIIYLKKAVELKNNHAKILLAKMYLENDDYEHMEQALTWLEEADNEAAYYLLGKEYMNGEHVEKNIDKAMHYFHLCKDNSHAYFQLGKLYTSEEMQHYEKGIFYYKKASNRHHEYAQVMLGNIYLQGEYVVKDIEQAIHYFTLANQQNNAFAQYALGKLFLFGTEVEQDKEKAIAYLTSAANQGNIYARYVLRHRNDYQRQNVAMITARFFHHIERIFRDNVMIHNEIALGSTDKKLWHKIKQKKIALGHHKKDHESTISQFK